MMFLAALAAAAGCLPVGGDRILAADVLKALPEFHAVPPHLVLSHSPQPGAARVFQPAELTQILRRHDAPGEPRSPVCFGWPLRAFTSEVALEAMKAALPGAVIRVVEVSRRPVPHGPVEFPLSGLATPAPGAASAVWKGSVRYTASKKIDVWAKVTVTVPFTRVVATRVVRPGERLDATAVRLESGEGHPPAPGTITRLEDALGTSARRLLPAGQPVQAPYLVGVSAVSKGDPVRVDVLAGPARLSFTAVAMTAGNVGQYVAVANPLNRKTLRVRVTGAGRAVIGAN